MKTTSKPTSTISYNSMQHLQEVLANSKKLDIVRFYAFIKHSGEKGGKSHYHVYIEPFDTLNTAKLTEALKEIDITDPLGKPLGVMPFQKSNFQDWYLYGKHDIEYLTFKGEKKEVVEYSDDNFFTSDNNEFMERVQEIDRSFMQSPIRKIENCMNQGMTMFQAMDTLRIPFGAMYAFQRTWISITEFKRDVNDDNMEQYQQALTEGVKQAKRGKDT